VYGQIVAILKNAHIPFEVYEHEPVTTSEEAAKVRNTDPHMGAKALVMYADDKPVMVVIAGDNKVDMKAFKQLFHVRDLRMATPEEVLTVTSVPIGAVPPFGHIFGIPIYMEEGLKVNNQVAFNAGLHHKSIVMKEDDYEKIAKPIVGSYAKVL
jgi:Ala-tRNA(Pro) deacylase